MDNPRFAHVLRAKTLTAYREAMSRQTLLTVFAVLMLAMALPTVVLLAVDDRTWRDVAIWAKPPLAGCLLQRYGGSKPGPGLAAFALTYGLGWTLLMIWALP